MSEISAILKRKLQDGFLFCLNNCMIIHKLSKMMRCGGEASVKIFQISYEEGSNAKEFVLLFRRNR